MNPQLYLCGSVFIARGDVKAVTKVFNSLSSIHNRIELLKLICVLWPELDDCLNLEFLWNYSNEGNESDVLLSLIQEDSTLVTISDMHIDTEVKRYKALSKYVDSRLEALSLDISEEQPLFDFLRARVIIADSLNTKSMAYLPLIERVAMPELSSWIEGILKPLDHLNRKLTARLTVREFESMEVVTVLKMMWDTPITVVSIVRSTMVYEVEPYLRYKGSLESFYEVIFNKENFPLDTSENFEVFKFLASFPLPDLEEFDKKKWDIVFENGRNLSRVPLPNFVYELQSILKLLGNDEQVFEGIPLSQWIINSQFMNDLGLKDLKSLKKLQEENSAVQMTFFSTMTQNMFQGNMDIKTLHSIIHFIESSTLFDKLSTESQQSVLLESLLKLGKFDVLEEFVSTSGLQIDDEVILQHFWRFFNNATVGSSSNPDIKKATRTLNLLTGSKKQHLSILLSVVEQLSHFSLSFKRGITFKPSHLLEFKTNPMEIIEKLLDLNPRLMKRIDTTFELLKNIYTALEVKPADENFSKEFSKLLSEHINNSLANGEFKFAFDQAVILVDRLDASDHWVTIFQVGKYVDPNWLDSETPTEIIYLQLGILSKLLHVCPEKEYEVIVSQWSGLELELFSRNLIADKYSLDNAQKNKDNFMNDVSANVSNFISSKFQWNV